MEQNENINKEATEARDLIKRTADATAIALNIQYIQRDITEIKQALKDISNKDEMFVRKEDFYFWRNLLVGGLLVTICIGVVMNLLKH